MSIIAFSTLLMYFAVLHVLKSLQEGVSLYPALVCLVWFVVEIVPVFVQQPKSDDSIHNFTDIYLFASAFLEGLTLLYPLMIIYGGHLTKRVLYGYFGGLALIIFVYPMWAVFGKPVGENYDTIQQMIDAGVYGELMFRFFILFYVFFHMLYVLHMISAFVDVYEEYLDETYSDTEKTNLRWFRMFRYPLFVMAFAFLLFMLLDHIALNIIYVVMLLSVMSMFLYHSLDLQPSDFYDHYRVRWSFLKGEWIKESIRPDGALVSMTDSIADVTSISDENVQKFKAVIDEWMQNERPYLHTDFRVAEVYMKLGIDRLACNEFFSKAYGTYFRTWVQKYRVAEAVRIIRNNPEKAIKEVAYESGFSSPSVFARSFASVTGMSCTKYREKIL